jgi:hypothetical protein
LIDEEMGKNKIGDDGAFGKAHVAVRKKKN